MQPRNGNTMDSYECVLQSMKRPCSPDFVAHCSVEEVNMLTDMLQWPEKKLHAQAEQVQNDVYNKAKQIHLTMYNMQEESDTLKRERDVFISNAEAEIFLLQQFL